MVSFIDEHRGEHGVEPICSALQVAPSTYYAAKKRQPSARALRDAFLKNVLFVLWSTNRKVYGAHKLWKAARRAIGLYKTECVYGPDACGWDDVSHLELATLSWVHWFNEERLHGYCGYIPPAEFEAAFYAGNDPVLPGLGNQ